MPNEVGSERLQFLARATSEAELQESRKLSLKYDPTIFCHLAWTLSEFLEKLLQPAQPSFPFELYVLLQPRLLRRTQSARTDLARQEQHLFLKVYNRE